MSCGACGNGATSRGAPAADAALQPPSSAESGGGDSGRCPPPGERLRTVGRRLSEGQLSAAWSTFRENPSGCGLDCWPLWGFALVLVVAWLIYNPGKGGA